MGKIGCMFGDRNGREDKWVTLFIEYTKNECVPDYRKCKKMITYHVVENTYQF